MVVVAAFHATGLSLASSVRLLDALALMGTIAIVYWTGRCLHSAGALLSFVAALLMAIGPATIYMQVGFGSPFFGFTIAAMFASAYAYLRAPSMRCAAILGCSCLIVSLTRPEGVIVAAFLLLALLVLGSSHPRGTLLFGVTAAYVIPGAVYFAWHWSYFGFPLPNPYYKKGGGHLFLSSLSQSVAYVLHWTVLITLLYVLSMLHGRAACRRVLLGAIPLCGFLAAWVLLSPETNYFGRFQYPAFVMVVVCLPELAHLSTGSLRRGPFKMTTPVSNALVALIILSSCIGLIGFLRASLQPSVDITNSIRNAALGRALAPFAHLDETVATTEAGLLPLYSRWNALDTWGLNDERIAHRGLDQAYLDKVSPSVVYAHVFPGNGPQGIRVADLGEPWADMCRQLRIWVAERHFVLAAQWRSSSDAFVVWVDPAARESAAMMAAVARVRVLFPATN